MKAIAGATLWLALLATPYAGNVPNPVVTGPIAAGAAPGDVSRDYPFFSSPLDLAARGYIEEEYFIEGLANRYLAAGTSTATPLESHPYRTRIIVRRPASAERFSGTVLIDDAVIESDEGNNAAVRTFMVEGNKVQ